MGPTFSGSDPELCIQCKKETYSGKAYKTELFKSLQKKTFCGFPMDSNQYWAGRVYELCVYFMTGTPEGSTESGYMEKPGIEPATPG